MKNWNIKCGSISNRLRGNVGTSILPTNIFLLVKILLIKTYLSVKVLPTDNYLLVLIHLQENILSVTKTFIDRVFTDNLMTDKLSIRKTLYQQKMSFYQ